MFFRTHRSLGPLLALAVGVTPLPTLAAPVSRPTAVNPGQNTPTVRKPLTMRRKGKVEISLECSYEFFNYQSTVSFYERPLRVCARWSAKDVTEWARWELYQTGAGGVRNTIASGMFDASSLAATESAFQVDLQTHLPQWNTGSTDQIYFVDVFSRKNAGDNVMAATAAKLVQKPQADKPVETKVDPYSCSSGSYGRKVKVGISGMTVNHTTTTSGDGDRDELYFGIARLGPGGSSGQTRLPGADDYYEGKNGKTFGSSGWTNQDGDFQSSPLFWNGTIANGQSVMLSVTAGEQDNADLASVKSGLQKAMAAVAAIAGAAGGYGAIVAAVAGAVAAGASFIPNTSGNDTIGFVALKLTNKCGYIQTVWTTFSTANTSAGTITNQFLDVGTLEGIESRVVTASSNPPGFNLDFGEYTYVHDRDEFFWIANGTSGSQYTFKLFEIVSTP
jgi:hypothetical protein